MVNFPPPAPTAGWYSRFLKGLIENLSEENAIIKANEGIKNSKEFSRLHLQNQKGETLLLPMPVEGGSRQLRDLQSLDTIILSEHGDWRKIHCGALEACLGKMPYYRHLETGVTDIYKNRDLKRLKDFNMAILRTLNSFLFENITKEELKTLGAKVALRERGEEISLRINPEISLLQAISQFGKETLLGIATI